MGITGGFGSAQKAKTRGTGYSGPDSTRPTQKQEADPTVTGGTAPGGIVAFMGAASQWANSNSASRNNFPEAGHNSDPISAAKMQHDFLPDEAPEEKGNVAINPGLVPSASRRVGQDANYNAPDGKQMNVSQGKNDPTANDSRPRSPNGRSRGQSPLVPKNPRGAYRP